MHLGWWCTLSERVRLEELRRHVAQRLSRLPHATDCFARSSRFGGWQCQPDSHFALSQHVREIRLGVSTAMHILRVCEHLVAKPLSLDQPLWEFFLLQPARGSSHVFLKVHRGLLPPEDEAAFLNALLDPQPKLPQVVLGGQTVARRCSLALNSQSQAEPDVTKKTQTAEVSRLVEPLLRQPGKAVGTLRAYADSLLNVARVLASSPPRKLDAWNGPLSSKRKLQAAEIRPSILRQVRDRIGGTITDMILSCFAASLDAVAEREGLAESTESIHALVPLVVGSEQDAQRTGVRTILAIARLPRGVSDPVERLRRVSAELDRLRALDTARHVERATKVLELLPTTIGASLAWIVPQTAPMHTACLQVPAIREQRYLAGTLVTCVTPFVPLALDIRVALAFMTYTNRVAIGFTLDGATSLSKYNLANIFESSLSALLAAAGVPPHARTTQRSKRGALSGPSART